jgi:hypothetical protein
VTMFQYITIGLVIGTVLAAISMAWWLMELVLKVKDADRVVFGPPRIEALRARVLATRETASHTGPVPPALAQPKPLPEPTTDTAWELISHADVKLFLSQELWEAIEASRKSTLTRGKRASASRHY